jgi:hypothetical protein
VLAGGGTEGLGLTKFLFSSVHKAPVTLSAGALEVAGSVNSELPAALLFSTVSSLDTASTEEAGFRTKSSSKESSRLTEAGSARPPDTWDRSSRLVAPMLRPPPWCSEDKAVGPPICPDGMETFLSGLVDDS